MTFNHKKISIAKNSSILDKIYDFIKYLFTGKGYDEYEKDESVLRYLLIKPIFYKIFCKILQIWSIRYIKNPLIYKSSDKNLKKVIDYTLNQVKNNRVIGSSRRMQIYYERAKTFSKKNLINYDLLIIGPKFIIELFNAYTYGYKWSKIEAVDLISFNPKIKLGDVDNLKLKKKFDHVVMANVFGYNKSPLKCFYSINKSLKKGGLLIFNSNIYKKNVINKEVAGTPRISLTQKINLFKICGFEIISQEIYRTSNIAKTYINVLKKVKNLK